MPNTATERLQTQIFRTGSKTYYHSSRLFPRSVRQDVSTLYAFVRLADNLVDDTPPQAAEFQAFRQAWRHAEAGTPSGHPIIDAYVELAQRQGFDRQWTEDFLDVMERDLQPVACNSLEEVLTYTWGSAEVIGLFMARILHLPAAAEETACLMGRSMQYINFIRDIAEDYTLGRRYLPLGDSGLKELSPTSAQANPAAFQALIETQASLYRRWQSQAQAGYRWLPWRFRVAVKTASDLYNWTIEVILKNPSIVWQRKVKPSQVRILWTAVKNLFFFPDRRFSNSRISS